MEWYKLTQAISLGYEEAIDWAIDFNDKSCTCFEKENIAKWNSIFVPCCEGIED